MNFDKIKAYIVNPEDRIIFSDPSSTETKFGTDIQIREDFSNLFYANGNTYNEYILFYIIIGILIIIILNYYSKNITSPKILLR